MLLKAVFALILALGVAGAVANFGDDPIPQCFPCPDVR
jgi:hypothetical protein